MEKFKKIGKWILAILSIISTSVITVFALQKKEKNNEIEINVKNPIKKEDKNSANDLDSAIRDLES